MNQAPMISVVTVCLNSAKTIRTTIESVLNQTYPNFEYIIKDGGSKDETLNICREYENAFRGKLRIISERDTGIYNAMNQGIGYCRGDVIALINSDDYYSKDTLEHVAQIYEHAESDLIVIIGDMERVSAEGDLIYRYHFDEEQVRRKQCFGHPSMFASKAVYKKIGMYDESYKLAADGDWQYRAHEDPDIKFLLCHEVFNHMREGGASDNPKYRWKWFHERVRMKKEHCRGSALRIYWQEFKSVIRTDIKAIIPKGVSKKLYEQKYKTK